MDLYSKGPKLVGSSSLAGLLPWASVCIHEDILDNEPSIDRWTQASLCLNDLMNLAGFLGQDAER